MPPNDGTDISEEEKKNKINEDVVEFLRNRSETEAPRYIARLKTYVNLQKKRRKAAAARRHSEQILQNEMRKSAEQKASTDKAGNGSEDRNMKRHGGERQTASRMGSRTASREPMDRCCRRRRRCCPRRRRRRSCCRRRRRRSCSRRRRRRRRRSCSRRRRRRSCRRRRKKCRRRRRR